MIQFLSDASAQSEISASSWQLLKLPWWLCCRSRHVPRSLHIWLFSGKLIHCQKSSSQHLDRIKLNTPDWKCKCQCEAWISYKCDINWTQNPAVYGVQCCFKAEGEVICKNTLFRINEKHWTKGVSAWETSRGLWFSFLLFFKEQTGCAWGNNTQNTLQNTIDPGELKCRLTQLWTVVFPLA